MLKQFYAHADFFSSRIAMADETSSWTYGELGRHVERTAMALRRSGLESGSRLLFWDTSKANYLIALLACMQERIALVPLPFQAPPAWRMSVAEQMQVSAVAPGLMALWQGEAISWPHVMRSDMTDVLAILTTSGTTGVPKGVPIHAEMAATAVRNVIDVFGLGPDTRFLDYIPPFTVGGLFLTGLPQLLSGSTNLVRTFSPFAFAEIVAGQRPTHAILLPTMVAVLRHSSSWAQLDLSSFAAIGSGASIVPESVAEDLLARGTRRFLHLYGATECLTPVMFHPSMAQTAGPRTIFSTLCGDYQAWVADDGELLLRGSAVMRGYLGAPAFNAEAFEDGWFRTGDLFTHDGGVWRMTGRKKEILKVGGFSVSPTLIEKVILDLPGVRNCAVVKETLRSGGEALVAVIEGSEVEPSAILTRCADYFPPAMSPRRVMIVEALPLNAMRKVDRGTIAKWVASDDPR